MRAGREASAHGSTVFEGSPRSGGGICGIWGDLPSGGGTVWGRCRDGGALGSAASGDGQRGGAADGRCAATGVGRRADLAAGADRRDAGPDAARDPGGAGGSRRGGELRRGVAVLTASGGDLLKKTCFPPLRDGRAGGPITPVWCGLRAAHCHHRLHSSTIPTATL